MSEQNAQKPFGAIPTDAKQFMEMLESLRDKLTDLYDKGTFPAGIVDPKAFLKALEDLMHQASEAFSKGDGSFPTDPTGWITFVEDSLKKVGGGTNPLDPATFLNNLSKMMTSGTDLLQEMRDTTTVQDLFNPGYWFRFSEQALRRTSDLMTDIVKGPEKEADAAPASAPEAEPAAG